MWEIALPTTLEYTPITELETGFTVNLNTDSIIEYSLIYLLCHVTQVHIICLQHSGDDHDMPFFVRRDRNTDISCQCTLTFSVPDRGPQYCDEHVCVSVCPHLHLRHTNFLGTLLGPRLAKLQYVMYFRFVDDVFQVMGPMAVWLYRSRVVAMSCMGWHPYWLHWYCIGCVLF